MRPRRTLLAATASALIFLTTSLPASADLGDCSQPFSEGEDPVVGDCLIILRAGIGLFECSPPCICDTTGDAAIRALDALLCLRHVVGLSAQLRCPCDGVTTTSSTTSSTLSVPSTTVSLPPPTSTSTTTTTLAPGCPVLMELTYYGGVRAQCATNDDCAVGSCDAGAQRCTTPSEVDIGWTGRGHDEDVVDENRLAAALECPGTAGDCGQCQILGLRVDGTDACRCENDNRRACDEPFDSDENDCNGNICQCYFGPPLPISASGTPLCLVQRIAGDVLGTLDPDAGALAFDLPLRTALHLADDLLAPCPACGGRCTAPPESTNRACLSNADCGPPDVGVCSGYDAVPGDGVRGGLCVGGGDEGFSCDGDAGHSTFPAPGGGLHSLDCFPSADRNVSGTGLRIRLQETTGEQSLATEVACGFPPSAPLTCACGTCANDPTRACSSNADCDAEQACSLAAGVAQPNACDDGTCVAGEGVEAVCANGPVDRFCDGIVRADGAGILVCNSNVDCVSTGLDAGACSLARPRECFPETIVARGQADPQEPVLAAVTCVAGTSSDGLNDGLGLPGPTRVHAQTALTTYCDTLRSEVYVPGDGCP